MYFGMHIDIIFGFFQKMYTVCVHVYLLCSFGKYMYVSLKKSCLYCILHMLMVMTQPSSSLILLLPTYAGVCVHTSVDGYVHAIAS